MTNRKETFPYRSRAQERPEDGYEDIPETGIDVLTILDHHHLAHPHCEANLSAKLFLMAPTTTLPYRTVMPCVRWHRNHGFVLERIAFGSGKKAHSYLICVARCPCKQQLI